MSDTIDRLVRHAAGMEAEEIPANVLRWSAVLFGDFIPCVLAGSTSDGIPEVRDSLLQWGGNPQATILGFGDRTSAPSAAFIPSRRSRWGRSTCWRTSWRRPTGRPR